MKKDGGYDAESFKAKYEAMDKNHDGKISKDELIESVLQVGRDRGLFGKAVAPVATVDESRGMAL